MRLIVCGMLTLTVLGCSNAQTAPAGQAAPQAPTQTQESVVAEVAGRKVTMKELDDRWQSTDPAERARVTQAIYQNRRNVLDQMIGDMLIEEAAKAAGMDAAEYTKQELAKRLQPVTDADVQQFFEANKDRTQGRTLEQLQGPMREFLTNQRQQQARAQLVEDLKKKSKGVRVLLDPPRQTITVAADDPYVGPATAAVTIVEYSDYQWPYCARVGPTLSKIRSVYGDKVRIVFKDFPLQNHAQAPKAHEAAHCAGEQGKYWPMHDRIFANQRTMEVPTLKQHAAALGLDTPKFDQCLDSGKFAGMILGDIKEGEQLGVQSTPTIFVNGRALVGAQPFEAFQSVIDEELARK